MKRISIILLALLFVLAGCSKADTEKPTGSESVEDLDVQDDAQADEDSTEEDSADEDGVDDAEDLDAENIERITQRWYVGGEKVACGASDDERCFRIRRANKPEWEVIEGDIHGFEWNEDIMSILEVEITQRIVQPDTSDEDEQAADDDQSKENTQTVEVRYEMKRQIAPLPEGEEEPTCTSNADCEDGEMCSGPAGCEIPWTCGPMRPCTKDLREYCSCEGETIRGSGSCPPVPYKHVGPCKETE